MIPYFKPLCIALILTVFSCRSPVPFFPERSFPDTPWTKHPDMGITVRYIPFDHAPEPLQPIRVPWANDAGIPDTVMVLVFIHEDGDASDPSIIDPSLNPELADFVLSAVGRTEFRPAYQNNHPIAAWIEIPIIIQKNR